MSYALVHATSDGAGLVANTANTVLRSATLVAGAAAAATVDLRDAVATAGAKKITSIAALQGTTAQVLLGDMDITNGIYVNAIAGSGATLTLVMG